jgi:hypothetical protein
MADRAIEELSRLKEFLAQKGDERHKESEDSA